MRLRDLGDGRSLARPVLDRANLEDTALPDDGFDLTGARITGADPELRGDGELHRSVVEAVDLSGTRLHPLLLADVELRGTELSNAQWHAVTARRVEVISCRAVGLGMSLDLAGDLYAEDCRFDYAGLTFGRAKGYLAFRGCTFREARLAGDLSRVVFADCDFAGAEFQATAARDCDLRTSRLSGARGLHSLRGATLDADQVIAVAGQLAAEAGLRIAD